MSGRLCHAFNVFFLTSRFEPFLAKTSLIMSESNIFYGLGIDRLGSISLIKGGKNPKREDLRKYGRPDNY